MILKNNFFFKFLVIFVTLWTVPFPLTMIPGFEINIYEPLVPWLGKMIFNLEDISTTMTGSGDTTFDYLILLFQFVLALLIALVWTLIADKNTVYEKLNYWFQALIRYFLGSIMVSYGLIKIIKTQFPEHSFSRLLQPYGDSSPMGLAWTFLGHSVGYNLFMGLAEFIGGVLLFHRKTRLLGALVLIPVISNIVAVNFFYDIPVKIFSSQLLIIALVLLIPDLDRLFSFLFNKPSKPRILFQAFESKNYRIGKEVIRWLFVLVILGTNISDTVKSSKTYGSAAPKPELYGLYEVSDFILNQDTLPPLTNDSKRWNHILIERKEYMQIKKMGKSRSWYKQDIDMDNKQIKISTYNDSAKVYVFDFEKTDTTLYMSGIINEDTINCSAKLLAKEDFLLTSRGFNWINERPYNR